MKHMIFAPALVMAALSLGSTPLLAAAKGSDEAQIKALEQRIAECRGGASDGIRTMAKTEKQVELFEIVRTGDVVKKGDIGRVRHIDEITQEFGVL